MLPITFAALCVAVISAESSSVSSYSSSPSNARDYEYSSGGNYHSSGGNKPVQYAEAYITTGGGSPYAKSDTRYTVETSSSDSTDPRTSAASSFYKSKYGSEAVVNSLRPTAFHTSSSSSPSSSSSSSSGSSDQVSPSHYSSSDYSSSGSSHPSSSSSSASSHYEGASNSAVAADYTSLAYGDRDHHHPHHHHQHHHQISGPVYSSASAAELAATGVSTGPSEYSMSGRPSGPAVYTREYAGEYTQSRPTSYSHGGQSLPASEYQSSHAHPQYHHHHQHAAYTNDEYPSQPMHSVPSHPYKTYVMSGPGPSSYPSKYQSVFGALKSFFGGGSDVSPSATHVSAYPSGPSYYSPSHSMMHAAAHHPAPSAYSGAPSSSAMASSAGSGYYFGPGPAASNSIYSKSYPSMRFVSGYGSSGAASSPGSKIIVVRDSSSALHGPGYSSGATSALIGSPSSYMTKSKLSAFAPAGPGHAYISSVSPSSLAYASGPPSSSYPGYSSSPTFSSSGHGGSTFLGYSA